MAQKSGWEESIGKLEDSCHEAIIFFWNFVESINYDILANLLSVWEDSLRGEVQRVFISVSNSFEELGIFASLDVVVSINVNLLSNVGNDVEAFLISSLSKALNLAYESTVS